MRTKLALIASLVLLSSGVALAQSGAGPTATTTTTAAEEKKDAPARFGGLELEYTIQDATGLNAVNYSNSLNMYFFPTWSIGKKWLKGTRFEGLALAGRLILTKGLLGYDDGGVIPNNDHGFAQTCSTLNPGPGGTVDVSQVQRCKYTNSYRWEPSDIWLTLRSSKIATIPKLEVTINPSVRFIIPTSYASRGSTLRLGVMPALGLGRAFFDKKLRVSYGFGVTKYFHEYTTPGQQTGQQPFAGDGKTDQNYAAAEAYANTQDFQGDPARIGTSKMNPSFALTHSVYFDLSVTKKFSISLLLLYTNAFAYEAQCGVQKYGNVETDPCVNANNVAKVSNGVGTSGRAHTDTQVFWLTLSYEILDWLTMQVDMLTWAPMWKEDGSYRQGIISTDYNAFTSVYVGPTISIDKLAAKLF